MNARYEKWINFVFDHPVTNPEWHWAGDVPMFEASEVDCALLIEQTEVDPKNCASG